MNPPLSRNFYDVLGVSQQAQNAEIKNAYHKQALERHPDKDLTNPCAVADFQALNQAYEVLSNDNRRVLYDAKLREGSKTYNKAAFHQAAYPSFNKQDAEVWAEEAIARREAQEQEAREEKLREEKKRKASEDTGKWLAHAGLKFHKVLQIRAKVQVIEANIRVLEQSEHEILDAEAGTRPPDDCSTTKGVQHAKSSELENASERQEPITQLISKRVRLSAYRRELEGLESEYERHLGLESEWWQRYARDFYANMTVDTDAAGQEEEAKHD